MRVRLPRPVRLALPGAAVLVLALGACGDPAGPAEPAPVAPPASAPPSGALPPAAGPAGSDGLTVRYLDHGTVRTVRVEDFPR